MGNHGYNVCMEHADPLELFLPPVRQWFRATLGEPTPAQHRGWPVIAAGQNTLILAPTGSGKTLAAFLACLDGLWRQRSDEQTFHVAYSANRMRGEELLVAPRETASD